MALINKDIKKSDSVSVFRFPLSVVPLTKHEESRSHGARISAICLLSSILILCLFMFAIVSLHAYAQDDQLSLISKKQKKLKEKEEELKKEEERLMALRKDIDERIERYSRLLAQIEDLLKDLRKSRDERLEQVVKTYEAMPPEEAAARISELDEKTATRILSMMKPKKASSIMAAMEPKKVASLTTGILKIEKKFPTR